MDENFTLETLRQAKAAMPPPLPAEVKIEVFDRVAHWDLPADFDFKEFGYPKNSWILSAEFWRSLRGMDIKGVTTAATVFGYPVFIEPEEVRLRLYLKLGLML